RVRAPEAGPGRPPPGSAEGQPRGVTGVMSGRADTRTARLAGRGGRPGSAEAAVRAGSKGRAVPLRDLQPASALPEGGRFHPERAQVDVPLGPVVDLVVDRVQHEGDDGARPLAEGDVLLPQA